MNCSELIGRLRRECALMASLVDHLRLELELIAADDVQALEDSMPRKFKIIREIQEIRGEACVLEKEPSAEDAASLRSLQQELVGMWKEASGLNEISRDMVSKRLGEIDQAVQVFFSGLKNGYARDGKKAGISLHTLRTGA